MKKPIRQIQSGTRRTMAITAALLTIMASGYLPFGKGALAYGETADNIAVKTNLLYDALTTPNLGLEMGLGTRHTIQLFYGLNPWTCRKDPLKLARHWVLMPEFRWWTCTKFNGHFFGIHLMGENTMQATSTSRSPELSSEATTCAKDCVITVTREHASAPASPMDTNGSLTATGT